MGRAVKPQARTQEVLVQQMGEETLVYDLDSDKVYCLNRTASLVWKGCDGQTTVKELAAALRRDLGDGADERVVWLALHQLQKAKLMGAPLEFPAESAAPSRREVLRNLRLIGGAAILLPVVSMTLAPKPAAALSCRPAGQVCSSTTQCCPGLLCSGGVCTPL